MIKIENDHAWLTENNVDLLLSQGHWITFLAKTSIQNNESHLLGVDIKKRECPSPQDYVKMNVHDRFNYSASSRIKQKLRFVINAGTEIKIALFNWS